MYGSSAAGDGAGHSADKLTTRAIVSLLPPVWAAPYRPLDRRGLDATCGQHC